MKQKSVPSGVTQAIAVARKLALNHSLGKMSVGPEYLLAGILKAMSDPEPHLRKHKLSAAIPLLEMIPNVTGADLKHLPPVEMTEELEQLLENEMRGFINGALPLSDAMNILLARRHVVARFNELIHTHNTAPSGLSSPHALTKALAKLFTLGLSLGTESCRCNGNNDYGINNPAWFTAAINQHRKEREILYRMAFSGKRGKPLSIFEHYMRTYGPIPAEAATAVMMNEFHPFANGTVFMTVRDIACAIAPDGYYAILGQVRAAVKILRAEGLVRVLPENENLILATAILPTEALIEDFTQYLAGTTHWDVA